MAARRKALEEKVQKTREIQLRKVQRQHKSRFQKEKLKDLNLGLSPKVQTVFRLKSLLLQLRQRLHPKKKFLLIKKQENLSVRSLTLTTTENSLFKYFSPNKHIFYC